MLNATRRYDTAESRWAGVGPYYAMFPTAFADHVIKTFTEPGDVVLDPFAGRGTALFSAAVQGRVGVGFEINPVGWVYSKAKLQTAAERDVRRRIQDLAANASRYTRQADSLPVFFHRCFTKTTRRFLIAVRDRLNWRRSKVDWTTMALLLVYLHGKRGDSLSNQMRQTKSMSPDYSISWWKKCKLSPPEIEPTEFMYKKITWRYAKGFPPVSKSRIYLGNATALIPRLARSLNGSGVKEVKLLFTSPPYYRVTNYHYDQWLRLWLLGFPPVPYASSGKYRGRFGNREEYRNLLSEVFRRASTLLHEESVIYVRTDKRDFTYKTTRSVLKELFPKKRLTVLQQPFRRPTQTHLFGDNSPKAGEVDIVLLP